MKKEIGKSEALYSTITITILLIFSVFISYQHFQPHFHEREMDNDQRERLARNNNFIISDEDWETYTKNKKEGSADAQRELYNKWRKERDERN